MKPLKYLFMFFVGFGFYSIVAANSVSVQTHPDYILVSWNQISDPPIQWTVTYSVMGTGYHSVLQISGSKTSVNISSTSYPGVVYMIKLYAINNGTKVYHGSAFIRSDCSKHTDTTIGSDYTVESFGYPGGLTRGAICTWTFTGNDVTWFRIKMEDFDLGNSSCSNHMLIGDSLLCDNDTVNGTWLILQPLLIVRLTYTEDVGKGTRFRVSAIHKLIKPTNVTAASIGGSIHVAWQQSSYHPMNLSYILHVSHYPFTSYLNLHLYGNATSYVYDVINHIGQNYSVQIQSVSEDLASGYTEPLFVKTNCDKDIFIRATEETELHTEGYPHYYLPDVSCNFRFRTEGDFYFRILTYDLDIGGGNMCSETYLDVEGIGRFCADTTPPTSLVIQRSTMNMALLVNEGVTGKGINMTVQSVAKPPPVPLDIQASSDKGYIHLTWKPPMSQRVYIQGYSVQYVIAPNTPVATLHVDKDVYNLNIDTRAHAGRVYALRVAAFTNGGIGNHSTPVYVRARCGHDVHIVRHQFGVIMSPSSSGAYEPGTLCRWNIKTESPLWIKLDINKLMLEYSEHCSKDYVEVSGNGRLCGSHKANTIVMKDTEVEITFQSDSHNESEGFSIAFHAVGPAPGQPRNVSVSQSEFAIVIHWTPPTTHRRFLNGYLVHFQFYGEHDPFNTTRVGKGTLYHVLDVTSFPGRLLQIWLQAIGDIEHSISTNKSFIRTGCGNKLNISEPTYMTSPYYANNPFPNIECVWTLTTLKGFNLKATFIRLNLNNDATSCSNYVRLSNESLFCDDSYENIAIVVNVATPFTMEFHTGSSGKGAYFLVNLQPVLDVLPESSTSSSISSCSDSVCSSTSLIIASYLGTVLASSLVTSVFISSDDIYSTDSPKETRVVQTPVSDIQHTPVISRNVSLTNVHIQASGDEQTNVIATKAGMFSQGFFVSQQNTPLLPTAINTSTRHDNGNSLSTPRQSEETHDVIAPTKTYVYQSSSFVLSNRNNGRAVNSTQSGKYASTYTKSPLVITQSSTANTQIRKVAFTSIVEISTDVISRTSNTGHTPIHVHTSDSSKSLVAPGDKRVDSLTYLSLPSVTSISQASSSVSSNLTEVIRASRNLEPEHKLTRTTEIDQPRSSTQTVHQRAAVYTVTMIMHISIYRLCITHSFQ